MIQIAWDALHTHTQLPPQKKVVFLRQRTLGYHISNTTRTLRQFVYIIQDLAQETFYRALKAFQGGRGWLPSAKEAYRPWLFRIATNLAIDLLRRRMCLTWCDLEAAAAVPTSGMEADPQEVYPHLEEAGAVRTTLGHLPDRYCRALVLHYQGGLTTPQVAQIIGLTSGGCKSLLKRARHAFARYYREQREVSA